MPGILFFFKEFWITSFVNFVEKTEKLADDQTSLVVLNQNFKGKESKEMDNAKAKAEPIWYWKCLSLDKLTDPMMNG